MTMTMMTIGADSAPRPYTVSQSAVNAHLAHGDTLGPCPVSPPDRGSHTTETKTEMEAEIETEFGSS